MQMMQRSFIDYCSQHDGYKCGYCKKPNSNYSHGMWAHTMTVSDYQDLIDRGWRRSGKYCYKPLLDVICCPMYTIRCRALEFKPSKSQKKVLKRFNKFLIDQDDISDKRLKLSQSFEDITEDVEAGEQFVETKRGQRNIDISSMDIPFIEEEDDSRNQIPLESSSNNSKINESPSTSGTDNKSGKSSANIRDANIKPKGLNNVAGPNPALGPCKKAKQLRRERFLQKLNKKIVDIGSLNNRNKNKEKQIEDFINDLPNDVRRKLEIKLVRTAPASAEFKATSIETHEVYVKYQTTIHGDRPEKCTEPKFHEFLVNSPLLPEYSEVGPPCGYGSFHQQYWLDGKIIAVGVIDILPKCISSVYFFYDPQYRNLTLGTYGALREIAFTRHLHSVCPDIKYYYMGFYIHSCPKMRYKGNFLPSDLVCPETYKWFPIRESILKLESVPNSRLDPNLDNIDENFPTESDIDYIPVLFKGEVMRYKMYRRRVGKKNEGFEEVQEYARLVGSKAARSLIMIK